jgi:hypothetical protein
MDKPGNIPMLKIRKDLPFKVPSGYFESFPEKLDKKIRMQRENAPVRRIILLKPYLAAAVVIVLALIGGSLVFRKDKTVDLNAQISQTIERELHSIPESVIIEVMSAPPVNPVPGVETDEIIDYLMDEDIQYEDLLNDF